MANIPETVYTKQGADAAISGALSGYVSPSANSVVDNGDGTTTITQAGGVLDNGDGTGTITPTTGGTGGTATPSIIDNGDGTFSISGDPSNLTDNGDGTFSVSSASLTERAYTKTAVDTALTAKAPYPVGGSDGQALVKSGSGATWATVSGGSTVVDATTTVKGVIQLAGDLAGTAALPVLKSTLGSSGTVGSATTIPVITYNNKGLITAISSVTAAGGSGSTPLPTTNSQTGLAYTLALTDAGNIVEQNSASTLTVTVPLNSVVAFPIGTTIEFNLYGTGALTLAGAAGVALRSPNGLRLVTKFASAAIRKRATDEWIVSGYTTV